MRPARRQLILALFGLLICADVAIAEERRLTLLHTNDLHARFLPDDAGRGGFAQLATLIRRECADSQGCLVLDGGDLVQGTPVSSIYRGLPVFEVANLIGLDASTLGNHEFDYGWRRIRKFLRKARFPIVTSNVGDERGRLLGEAPHVVLEANGVRVGVIGALTETLDTLTTADLRGPWTVRPVVETIERYLSGLRRRSDLVVVLGHLEEEEERAILASIPEVAVVVSGHDHAGLGQPIVIDGRPIVRVRAYGRQLGRLDMTVDLDGVAPARWSWRAIDVDALSIEPDPLVARSVARWESKVAHIVDVPIGTSTRIHSRTEVRALVEQALRDRMGTDLGYVNRGGIRDRLPAGSLLARHVWNVMPFDNFVVTGTFPGSALPEAVRRERELDPGRTYSLTTMDFVARRWAEEGCELAFTETGLLVRDAIIDWIRERGVVGGEQP